MTGITIDVEKGAKKPYEEKMFAEFMPKTRSFGKKDAKKKEVALNPCARPVRGLRRELGRTINHPRSVFPFIPIAEKETVFQKAKALHILCS